MGYNMHQGGGIRPCVIMITVNHTNCFILQLFEAGILSLLNYTSCLTVL